MKNSIDYRMFDCFDEYNDNSGIMYFMISRQNTDKTLRKILSI